ncbi:MAG: HAD family hydrolase [Clostridia bacterium]|nr:HAD family hydrolase [Clostridia bacterium]
MIKLIAFDMDGTLTDTSRMIPAIVNKTLAHYGKGPLPAERILCHVGHGARNLLIGVMEECGFEADIDEIFAYYDSLYDEDPSPLVDPYEGVKEMLAALGEKGVRRVVLSNRPHNQTLLICKGVLGGYLDEVYGQREGIPMKPDPTALHTILRDNGVSEQECLYMGDMHFDVDVAKNAGVRSVGCVWGLGGYEQVKTADFVIQKPLELLDILEK